MISIIISCLAFAFSVLTWRERTNKDRRDLFLRVHERLIDVDLQRGRRILTQKVHSVEDAAALLREDPEAYDCANRALAMLDIAALYVDKKYLDRKLFLGEWGPVYARSLHAGRIFIQERVTRTGVPVELSWRHFQSLAEQASKIEVETRWRRGDPQLSEIGP